MRDQARVQVKQAEVQEKRDQLNRKEVIISVFGRHNCGKSTLLNALLKNKYVYIDLYLHAKWNAM